eukprot:TRINITY_DN61953_c0_g1_i1.p1 TRINITY_DN61953_c0_g1~~TRINITY_DN61953_c0_g1_i1.p1  ORF type:complete len:738 (-),score=105.01 TRINITY_DN61953_c0_g1_i1:34-2247(-)
MPSRRFWTSGVLDSATPADPTRSEICRARRERLARSFDPITPRPLSAAARRFLPHELVHEAEATTRSVPIGLQTPMPPPPSHNTSAVGGYGDSRLGHLHSETVPSRFVWRPVCAVPSASSTPAKATPHCRAQLPPSWVPLQPPTPSPSMRPAPPRSSTPTAHSGLRINGSFEGYKPLKDLVMAMIVQDEATATRAKLESEATTAIHRCLDSAEIQIPSEQESSIQGIPIDLKADNAGPIDKEACKVAANTVVPATVRSEEMEPCPPSKPPHQLASLENTCLKSCDGNDTFCQQFDTSCENGARDYWDKRAPPARSGALDPRWLREIQRQARVAAMTANRAIEKKHENASTAAGACTVSGNIAAQESASTLPAPAQRSHHGCQKQSGPRRHLNAAAATVAGSCCYNEAESHQVHQTVATMTQQTSSAQKTSWLVPTALPAHRNQLLPSVMLKRRKCFPTFPSRRPVSPLPCEQEACEQEACDQAACVEDASFSDEEARANEAIPPLPIESSCSDDASKEEEAGLPAPWLPEHHVVISTQDLRQKMSLIQYVPKQPSGTVFQRRCPTRMTVPGIDKRLPPTRRSSAADNRQKLDEDFRHKTSMVDSAPKQPNGIGLERRCPTRVLDTCIDEQLPPTPSCTGKHEQTRNIYDEPTLDEPFSEPAIEDKNDQDAPSHGDGESVSSFGEDDESEPSDGAELEQRPKGSTRVRSSFVFYEQDGVLLAFDQEEDAEIVETQPQV